MTLKKLINIAVIVVLVIAGIVLIAHFAPFIPAIGDQTKSATPGKPHYGTAVCDNAFDKTIDHSQDAADHFTISLPEGCFSSFIILPRSWSRWSYQHGPNSESGWVAFWFYGIQQPSKPLSIDDNGQLELDKGWAREKWKLRVEGKGKLIFFKIN